MTGGRAIRWLTAAGVLVLVVLGIAAAPAGAHVEAIKRSDPSRGAVVPAVAAITVEFTDSVRPTSASFVLRSSDGRDHPLADAVFRDDDSTVELVLASGEDLPEGLFRLGYQVVFPDGHPAAGVVQFEVSRTGTAKAAPWPADDPAPSRAEPDRLDVSRQVPWLVGGALVVVAGFVWFLRRQRRSV